MRADSRTSTFLSTKDCRAAETQPGKRISHAWRVGTGSRSAVPMQRDRGRSEWPERMQRDREKSSGHGTARRKRTEIGGSNRPGKSLTKMAKQRRAVSPYERPPKNQTASWLVLCRVLNKPRRPYGTKYTYLSLQCLHSGQEITATGQGEKYLKSKASSKREKRHRTESHVNQLRAVSDWLEAKSRKCQGAQ